MSKMMWNAADQSTVVLNAKATLESTSFSLETSHRPNLLAIIQVFEQAVG